jgi:hypothetical protein
MGMPSGGPVRPVSALRHEHGVRVYVCGRRLHHGLTGFVCCVGGLWAMWADRRDWPWFLRSEPFQFRGR